MSKTNKLPYKVPDYQSPYASRTQSRLSDSSGIDGNTQGLRPIRSIDQRDGLIDEMDESEQQSVDLNQESPSINGIIDDTDRNVKEDDVKKKADKLQEENDMFIEDGISINKRMSIAGGFLDFALFTANVEHLKYILDEGECMVDHYKLLLYLLYTSLALQVLSGILIFVVGFSDTSKMTREKAKWVQILNYITIGLVSFIGLINVVITTFGDRTQTDLLKRAKNCFEHNSTNTVTGTKYNG